MRTLQEKYNAVLEGKFSKEQFRRDAVMQLPNMVSKFNSFEDMTTILKNRSMLAEAKKEEVTAYKKPEVETADLIAPDLLDHGIKAELEAAEVEGTPSEEEYEKAKEKAAKNLAKDPLCYKNAQTMPEVGEKMEKAKLHEETALDRAEDHASAKVQDKLGDIADTVTEKPASVAAAFRKMVLANPTHYAKMSAHELEQEFEKFKLEEANKVEDGIELTADEMETLRREKKITLPDGRVLHYVGKPANEEESNVNVDDFEEKRTNTRDFAGPTQNADGTYNLPELREAGEPMMIGDKEVDPESIEFEPGFDYDSQDQPIYVIKSAKFVEGTALTDSEIDTLNSEYPQLANPEDVFEGKRAQLKEAVKALIKKTLEA